MILAMKAHQVEAVADDVPKLFGPDTAVVTMQNGIPFWYFHRPRRRVEGTRRAQRRPDRSHQRKDPCAARHRLRRLSGIRARRARRREACRRRSLSARRARWPCERARQARLGRFESAGFKAPVLDNIRAEIWLKLWGNLTFNPISALSHSTLVDICQFPLSRELAAAMMSEAQAVAGQARHRVPRAARKAHRRRREGRQAQDLDAAGHRGRARAGDRCAGRFGDRARPAHRHADAAHRHGLLRWSNFLRGRWKSSKARSGYRRPEGPCPA